MHKFFSNRRLVFIVVVLVLAFGLMGGSVALRKRRATPPLIQQFGNDVVGIANDVIAVPVNVIQNGLGSYTDLLNTYSENRKLKEQVSDLAQVKVRDETLAHENKQLKKELKVQHTMTDYSTINAAVVTRSPSSWQKQLIINKGQTSGVKKNMPVMSAGGLVGRVVEVNQTNSKVELLSDTSESANRFAIQLNGEGSKTINGIITGYDSETNELIMGQVTSKAKVKKGTKVTTSGLGGVTPKGLYVGKVSRVGKDDYGLAQKIYIKPAADFNDVNVVTVAELNS